VKVGYNQTVSAVVAILGAIGVIVALLFELYPGLLVTSPIFLLCGVLMLVRPYFVYEPGTVGRNALVGPIVFRHSGELRFKDGRLRCTDDDGRTRKVPVMRVLSDPDDWRAFRARLKEDNAAARAGAQAADVPHQSILGDR